VLRLFYIHDRLKEALQILQRIPRIPRNYSKRRYVLTQLAYLDTAASYLLVSEKQFRERNIRCLH
jgi:hypothetical protein